MAHPAFRARSYADGQLVCTARHSYSIGEEMKSPYTALAGLLGCMILASACSTAVSSPSTTAITATLKEYSIQLSAATAPAGSVTFTVTNSGTMVHEFVVLKTDIAAAALPLTSGEVAEANFEKMGEVADIAAGASGTLTVTLAAGHYAIICNLPGHVVAGMVVDLMLQ